MNTERIEAMCGGKGHVLIKHILGEKELNGGDKNEHRKN